MAIRPGWGVSLAGEKIDLIDLQQFLPAPFDPWVEEFSDAGGAGVVLRSLAWQNLVAAREVQTDANRILERLHGFALLHDPDATRIRPGLVFKFHADGRRETHSIVHSAEIRFTGGRARVRGVAARNGVELSPSESEAQRQYRLAEVHQARSEVFTQISRGGDWYDLFKVLELVQRIAGGKNQLMSLLGALGVEWKRIWQTANCNRHAPDPQKYPYPIPPAELADAWPFVLAAAKDILSRHSPISAP